MYQIVDMIMDCKFLISELIIPNVHLLAAIFKSQHVVNHHLERERRVIKKNENFFASVFIFYYNKGTKN